MQEKTKRWKKSINPLKESQEIQNRTIKWVKKKVQKLKIEIDTIKKIQAKRIQGIENLGKWTGTTETSIINRLEEIISGAEDTIEKIDSLLKENIKFNKFLTQNIQEIWDTMKRPNLRIIAVEEGEELQLKGPENIFNKIIENFPNLKKDIPMKVQEAYRTPNRLDQKKDTFTI